MPQTVRRGRPRGGAMLTRERIIAEAAAMIEDNGSESATMRGLARRLGVDPMSLYNHVEGRDGLLDAVTEYVLAGMEIPVATGNFGEDLRAVAQSFRNSALRYPRCAPLVLTRQLNSLEGLAPVEAVLTILADAGVDRQDAVHVLRAALAYVIGALLREVSASPTFSGENLGGVERRLSALEASAMPHVVEAAPLLAVCVHETEFAFGLDLMVGALESRYRTG